MRAVITAVILALLFTAVIPAWADSEYGGDIVEVKAIPTPLKNGNYDVEVHVVYLCPAKGLSLYTDRFAVEVTFLGEKMNVTGWECTNPIRTVTVFTYKDVPPGKYTGYVTIYRLYGKYERHVEDRKFFDVDLPILVTPTVTQIKAYTVTQTVTETVTQTAERTITVTQVSTKLVNNTVTQTVTQTVEKKETSQALAMGFAVGFVLTAAVFLILRIHRAARKKEGEN